MKLYKMNGHWYLGFETKGILHICSYVGQVGDCIRP